MARPPSDAMRKRVRTQPGWRIVELPSGHCPQVTMPDALVQVLLDVCSSDSGG